MREKTPADYLRDMLHEIADVEKFTVEGKAVFMQDTKTRKAVIRSYEIIGEITKRLPAELRDANPNVNWQKLTRFRDFLTHNYERVIVQNLWDAVEDLPNLRDALEAMLVSLEDGSNE